ncbi:hypothetical protein [Proteus terrae]|uniref:hypothetical protein n=1 Tax=Proteus terrae TaxID=1574161 RepID=UPI0022483447|nr:hypothetical protein [Proteus terrae]MCW9689102.1 hypothetical protein [Proteus terrae]
MIDNKEIFHRAQVFVEAKQWQLHDEIYKKGWRGLSATSKENAIDMLQMKDPRVSETANELYEKIMKSSNPYKRLEKDLLTDHVELTRVHYGSNVYLLNTIFWSCVTFHLAVKFHKLNRSTEFEVMAMQCLLKSLEIVSESFGLGVYSYYSKDLNRLRLQRSDAAKEGRKARTNLLNRIKKEASDLLYTHKPPNKKWKSKAEAAREIEGKLWSFIQELEENGEKTDLVCESLDKTIVRWSKKEGKVKLAMEKTVRIRKSANSKKKIKETTKTSVAK